MMNHCQTLLTISTCAVTHWRGVCCQAAADFLEVAEALTNERLDGAATTALTKEKLEAAALTDEKPSAEPQAAALTDVPPFAVLGLVRVLASHAFERPHCHICATRGAARRVTSCIACGASSSTPFETGVMARSRLKASFSRVS